MMKNIPLPHLRLPRLGLPRLGLPRLEWFVIFRAVIAILFGLAVFLWPSLTATSLTLRVLAWLFGTFAVLDGVLNVMASLAEHERHASWWVYFVEGLTGIVIGLIAFVVPAVTGFVLLYLIVVWAIIQGLLELCTVIWLRDIVQDARLEVVNGVTTILFGLVLLARPGTETDALAWLGVIGYYALVLSVLELTRAIQLRARTTVALTA